MYKYKIMILRLVVLAAVTGAILTAAAVNNKNTFQLADSDKSQGFLSTSQTDLSEFSIAERAKALLEKYSYINNADIDFDASTPDTACVNIILTLNGQDALSIEQEQDIMEQMTLMFSDYNEVRLTLHNEIEYSHPDQLVDTIV